MKNNAILMILLLSISALAEQSAPKTMRLDYFHTGNATQELFSVDEVVIEPKAWAGNLNKNIDTLPRGKYIFEVNDLESGKLLYSRSFSSIYGEWETTGEATKVNRTFHESLRFPAPEKPVEIRLKKRSYAKPFHEIWKVEIDPSHMFVNKAESLFDGVVYAVFESGKPENKVDLLVMGDGYSQNELPKFKADVKKMTDALFATEPFKSRRTDFNVWAMLPSSEVSGVSRPSTGIHKDTPINLRYDIFGSERYMLTLDNKAFRQLAANAPYEFVEILANEKTYGGGGIYGLYGTSMTGNNWSEYVFVHEFGHHFAGLADEYYTSPVAYAATPVLDEPYEPNVTANTDRDTLKWKQKVNSDTPIPTTWAKKAFDQHSYKYQKRRNEIRQQKLPESVMSALFDENAEFELGLFSKNKYKDDVGLFEGANYTAQGYYRSQQNCIMFTRIDDFCHVCSHAIEETIDLYTGSNLSLN